MSQEIEHGLAVVDDHRNLALAGEGDPVLLGEAPCLGVEGQALMEQGEPDPPTVRTEAPVFVGAGQVPKLDRHPFPPSGAAGLADGFGGLAE